MKIPRFDPIDVPEKDLLGSQEAAEKLVKILDNVETPNCFGIYGVWGSGKTSLMKLTKNILDTHPSYKDRIATVWFDPWKYEYDKSAPITFPLLYSIQKTFKNAELTSLFKRSGKYLSSMGLALVGAGLKHAIGIDLKDLKDDLKTADEEIYSEYERWVNAMDSFKEEYEDILKKILKHNQKEKLFIFIDDMDRCLQENVMTLLEIMKNYLSVENTLFIFGMDRRVMIDHVNQKYSQTDEYGVEYLAKIIPLSISLPAKEPVSLVNEILRKAEIKDLSSEEINLISKYLEKFCGTNRRMMHIILYKFLMVLSYINLDKLKSELIGTTPTSEFRSANTCRIALFRWCIFEEKEPRFFDNPDWPDIYNIDINTDGSRYREYHRGWRTDKGLDPLTPYLYPNHGIILHKYISDGLFFKVEV